MKRKPKISTMGYFVTVDDIRIEGRRFSELAWFCLQVDLWVACLCELNHFPAQI